jgi:hypothetical protein
MIFIAVETVTAVVPRETLNPVTVPPLITILPGMLAV